RRRPRRRGHEVVQGAVSLAQPGCGGDRAMHEVERVLHRALERAAERQPRGDGGGERAAGAVSRGRLEARTGEASSDPVRDQHVHHHVTGEVTAFHECCPRAELHERPAGDRKSTRLNSSHVSISYAVFCLKKKKKRDRMKKDHELSNPSIDKIRGGSISM